MHLCSGLNRPLLSSTSVRLNLVLRTVIPRLELNGGEFKLRNGLKEHRPTRNINRLRKTAYPMGLEYRKDLRGIESKCPRRIDEFSGHYLRRADALVFHSITVGKRSGIISNYVARPIML